MLSSPEKSLPAQRSPDNSGARAAAGSRGARRDTSERIHMAAASAEGDEGLPLERGAGGGGWRARARRRVPALGWAARYSRAAALADLVAGVTLGLTLVPQSIAYAALADLPVQYGLYSAFLGTMLYAALGTVKEVSMGPTSLMALLTLQTCRGLPADYVVLLTFLSGCVVLLMAVLRLGFLVDLISPSVTSGFTSATAVIVAGAQVKGLLGLSFTADSLLQTVLQLARHLPAARLPDCLLSLACCAALLALRKLKDLPVSAKRRRLRRALWLVAISRNALVVCAASVAAYLAHDPARADQPLFKLTGRVEHGVPRLSLPPFSSTLGNRTVAFPEMVATLGSGVIMLPLVMVLANIAIAKAFTRGARVDATQEMVALGLCNVAGALVHAMPSCGAFTRSAVGHSSGVRTPAASLYAGLVTLLALNFLTQYFYYIPKACLSSVLVCAVIFMVDFGIVVRLWREARGEALLVGGTFVLGVWRSVELAVLLGSLAALALALRALLAPPAQLFRVKVRGGEAVRVRAPRVLLYANAERLEARVLAAPAAPPLLLDLGPVAHLDYTAAQVLGRLIKKLEARSQSLVLYNAAEDVAARLRELGGVDERPLRTRTPQAALDAATPPAPAAPPPERPPSPPAPGAAAESAPLLEVVGDRLTPPSQ